VTYNSNAFENLLLDEDIKSMIKSVITFREKGLGVFDDIIQRKGKGLVFLLHGPSGVGKTLTAGK